MSDDIFMVCSFHVLFVIVTLEVLVQSDVEMSSDDYDDVPADTVQAESVKPPVTTTGPDFTTSSIASVTPKQAGKNHLISYEKFHILFFELENNFSYVCFKGALCLNILTNVCKCKSKKVQMFYSVPTPYTPQLVNGGQWSAE